MALSLRNLTSPANAGVILAVSDISANLFDVLILSNRAPPRIKNLSDHRDGPAQQ